VEAFAVDRPDDDPWGDDPGLAQGCVERHTSAFRANQWRSCRGPVPERRAPDRSRAPRRPPTRGRHIGLGPGLVHQVSSMKTSGLGEDRPFGVRQAVWGKTGRLGSMLP
jgi:hypothetical protein